MAAVGILTFVRSYNYGAVLQAYALQESIRSLGFDPWLIDVRKNPGAPITVMSMRAAAKRMVTANSARGFRTEAFRRRYLSLTPRAYTYDELKKTPPRFECYVTGSDQVFNPMVTGGNLRYLLDFCPPGSRRVAYAASFGVPTLPSGFAMTFAAALRNIDYLSVREASGRRIIRDLIQRDAQVVLDPTLLVPEESLRLVSSSTRYRDPYVLCHVMPGNTKVERAIDSTARRIAKSGGYRVRAVNRRDYRRLAVWERNHFGAGPSELLRLIDGAECVVTNSFHGVALSIAFGKPFVVPIDDSVPVATRLSTRISELLELLGLRDREAPIGNDRVGDAVFTGQVPLPDHHRKLLANLRSQSYSFLRNAIGAS